MGSPQTMQRGCLLGNTDTKAISFGPNWKPTKRKAFLWRSSLPQRHININLIYLFTLGPSIPASVWHCCMEGRAFCAMPPANSTTFHQSYNRVYMKSSLAQGCRYLPSRVPEPRLGRLYAAPCSYLITSWLSVTLEGESDWQRMEKALLLQAPAYMKLSQRLIGHWRLGAYSTSLGHWSCGGLEVVVVVVVVLFGRGRIWLP